ncbi:MAG: Npt1/Npt2 family nucleotide transporter [Polyangiales bacterium]
MTPLSVRKEDRQDLTFGFVGLLMLMAAHAMLETARDALFLAGLPATDLPWAYLAIAVLATAALRGQQRLLMAVGDRHLMLSVSLLGGAAVTVGFWFSVQAFGPWSLLAFYVWTGLLATVLIVQFWLLLDESVTVTRAKRIFPLIAAGGVVGAIVGSMGAEVLLRSVSAEGLLLAGATLLGVGAVLPFVWKRQPREALRADPLDTDEAFSLRSLLRDRYLAKLFVLVLVGTVSVTAVDYVFKSEVASHVPPEQLGTFFARFYLALNSVALLVQLVGARWMLESLGVHRSAAALPVLLIGGVLGLVLGPLLLGAVALKSIDGSMRHSLYRTAIEVLYLPLGSARRQRAKTLIDGFGHRGGQALASLVILAAVWLGLSTVQIAAILILPLGIWLFAIFSTQKQYEEIFRTRLRHGALETRLELQELDLHSLEVLLSALNSEHDDEVLAAIDLFDTHGRAQLLPVLILYHPSEEIRQRALRAFADAGDVRFVPIARRMLDDEACEVRATALRALTAVAPDRQLLTERMKNEAPIVEATGLIGLLSIEVDESTLLSLLSELRTRILAGTEETCAALAEAIRDRPSPIFHDALIELARAKSEVVRRATADAMVENPDPRYPSVLLPWLAKNSLRPAARAVMLAVGPDALAYLDVAMYDPDLPRKVRRHIPRTISRFPSKEAVPLLLDHLERERDGAVRYKILRGLGRIRATEPSLRFDRARVEHQLRKTLVRVVQLVRWRAVIEAGPVAETPTQKLLWLSLRDKERSALERAFRLMGIVHPQEDFALVWRGVQSDDPRAQAAGREVLDATLSSATRDAVLALVDDSSHVTRADRAAAALGVEMAQRTLDEAFKEMLHDESIAIRCIVANQVAESSMRSLVPELERVQSSRPGPFREAVERALAHFRDATDDQEVGSLA